jgi:hypothetical protein
VLRQRGAHLRAQLIPVATRQDTQTQRERRRGRRVSLCSP